MPFFQVTSSQLRAKSEELNQLNSQLRIQISTLDETETGLSTMWEGEARNAFHSAFQRDRIQFENFYNAIAQYTQALQTIAAKYDQAESQNVEKANTRSY